MQGAAAGSAAAGSATDSLHKQHSSSNSNLCLQDSPIAAPAAATPAEQAPSTSDAAVASAAALLACRSNAAAASGNGTGCGEQDANVWVAGTSPTAATQKQQMQQQEQAAGGWSIPAAYGAATVSAYNDAALLSPR
jgi:hypothetical protein